MRIKKPIRTIGKVFFLKAPIEAQLIVIRRCNLSCGYCTEYDKFSAPIPLTKLKERIDALHRLNVVNITLLGGEPLLHPKICETVEYANRHAQVSITTNGFLLSENILKQLNEAGLSNMQISIDTLRPDDDGYLQKSMKSVFPKLEGLKQWARFQVHVNIVLCEKSKDEFKTMLKILKKIGFYVSVNLIHDNRGMVMINDTEYLELWEHYHLNGSPHLPLDYEYGKRLLQEEIPEWKCRAGSRYLYIDEHGNTQFCSAQRGRLNKPIIEYTRKDLRQHSKTYKGCESACSIFCGYRSSLVDNAPIDVIKALYQNWRRSVNLTLKKKRKFGSNRTKAAESLGLSRHGYSIKLNGTI